MMFCVVVEGEGCGCSVWFFCVVGDVEFNVM